MKIINTVNNETVSEIIGGNNLTLDEAILLVGEIHPTNENENVMINGEWYYYEDLAYVVA